MKKMKKKMKKYPNMIKADNEEYFRAGGPKKSGADEDDWGDGPKTDKPAKVKEMGFMEEEKPDPFKFLIPQGPEDIFCCFDC